MTGKLKSILFALVVVSALHCGAEITTTKFYDNRKCAVVWTSDDMLKKNYSDYLETRWTNFWEAAALCKSNNLVFSPAIIVIYMEITNGWTELTEAFDCSSFVPLPHSWEHPINITNYNNEYVVARQTMFDRIVYPWQKTYKGREYEPAFIQFGSATNIDYDTAWSVIATNNYLGIRVYSKTLKDYPEYTNGAFGSVLGGSFGSSAQWIKVSAYGLDIVSNTWETIFNECYANQGVFHLYTHAWDANGKVTNHWSEYTNFAQTVGGKTDVWPVDFSSLLTYRYTAEITTPEIVVTSSADGRDRVVVVTGDALERDKYGLSYPVTYLIPRNVMRDFDGYTVYYRDAVETNWTAMTEKTTNDYFTGINCYRNDGTNLFISQGLPQTVDTFEVRLQSRKQAFGFF